MSEFIGVVVNADDFGLSPGVNDGIQRAHEHGIVTSASLMVRQPAAQAAAYYARDHPSLGVGLHVDVGEWRYNGEEWVAVYTWVDEEDEQEVAAEIDRQIEQFRALLGRDPDHLDSHQHVHLREPSASILLDRAVRLGVPLRRTECGLRYEGGFYGQTDEGSPWPQLVGVPHLLQILAALPRGVSELCCHPSTAVDIDTAYAAERLVEAETLCDDRVKEAVDDLGISLLRFADVRP